MKNLIKPFKATFFNPELNWDLASLVCPPYDVIDKELAKKLRKKSPYNYCRINLAPSGNYQVPAKNFANWLRKKILVEDSRQGYYLYQRKFKVNNKSFLCYGIFCLLDMKQKKVFPHEHTLTKPKKDRKKMLTNLKAHLSPVFVVSEEKNNFLNNLAKDYSRGKPFLQFRGQQGFSHKVWKIQEEKPINTITASLSKSCLVIADGHHRFETAFDYFKKNGKRFKDLDYVFAYLTFEQPGLLILPTHRLVTIKGRIEKVFDFLSRDFLLQEVKEKDLLKKIKNAKKFSFGVCLDKKFYFACLKNEAILGKIKPKVYLKLDAYIFHHLVLPKLTYEGLEYSHSLEEIKRQAQKRKVAFLLRQPSFNSVFKVAKAGYKLPQKTTYFYPKILSGIMLRRFSK